MKDHLHSYSEPKTYDYIPETYKISWEEPHKFIPTRMQRSFNQQLFYNFLHRECFNSCLSKSNKTNVPNSNELMCYENCRNKHLSSIGIFSDIVLSKRKWGGFLSYLHLREYQKDPDEMGKHIPFDPFLRQSIFYLRKNNQIEDMQKGFYDIFNLDTTNVKKMSTFEYYLYGPAPKTSQKYQNMMNEIKNKGDYVHYQELLSKHGKEFNNYFNQVEANQWKDIEGDDFQDS
jgi:hypothetical protein